jgi:hypothetical protein
LNRFEYSCLQHQNIGSSNRHPHWYETHRFLRALAGLILLAVTYLRTVFDHTAISASKKRRGRRNHRLTFLSSFFIILPISCTEHREHTACRKVRNKHGRAPHILALASTASSAGASLDPNPSLALAYRIVLTNRNLDNSCHLGGIELANGLCSC